MVMVRFYTILEYVTLCLIELNRRNIFPVKVRSYSVSGKYILKVICRIAVGFKAAHFKTVKNAPA